MNIISRILLIAALGIVLCVPTGCNKNGEKDEAAGEKKWNQSEAEAEYEILQSEYRLASTVKPYLVFNLRKKELEIKLKGVVVWSTPLDLVDDSEDYVDFARTFKGSEHHIIRPLLEKHMFAFSDKTPDSILVIVGEAVMADPKLLQREIPERFQLLWDNNLVLDVRTNVAGKPISKFKNTIREIRRMIQKPFGEAVMIIRMEPDMALTLYRACEPGLPTMIYPASFK
jgi:hypothetical protein